MSEAELSFSGLRKAPQQARSRARVRAILAAAEDILAADGVEGLTMRVLAERADVPMGTVYQFFEDKTAVLDTVVRSRMASFDALLSEMRDMAAKCDWSELFDAFFDRMIDRCRADRGYMAIWIGHHLGPEMRRADDANIDATAGLLRSVFVDRYGLIDSAALVNACRVAIQTGDALLQLAFRVDPDGDQDTLAEARRIEHLYLEDIATNSRYRRAG